MQNISGRVRQLAPVWVVFIIALLIRSYGFNRPLSDHQEWLTAHTMLTLRFWDKEGISKHHFSPVYTASDSNSKYFQGLGGVIDSEGRSYYISYPPFGFILPFCFYKLLNLPFEAKWLQIFNLLLSLFSAYFLFRIIDDLLLGNRTWLHWFAQAMFQLSAAGLWFGCNVYFVDMLSWTLVTSITFYLLRMLAADQLKKIQLILLFILFFALAYTEWIAVLLAFVLSILIILSGRLKTHWRLILITGLATLSAICITLYQYSLISGWHNLMITLVDRYAGRSGLAGTDRADGGISITNYEGYRGLSNHYLENFKPWLLLILALIVILIATKFSRKSVHDYRKWHLAMALSVLPVILHHLVFFNFSAIHDFAEAKAGFPLAVLLVYLQNRLLTDLGDRTNLKLSYLTITFAALLATSLSVHEYFKVNKCEISQYRFQTAGLYVKSHLPQNVTVFMKATENMNPAFPQFIYYAERNAFIYWNDTLAIDLMKRQHVAKGIVLEPAGNTLKVAENLTIPAN